ncbi:hypothetical protein BKA65DRAFT_539661 [Rhexocercosporidium sp. MPI-PUGE-AT-0058]|nr:hypothetical protein BKA65DRAFT_539661 [Rhexocercosporidium sp. MPI-PUGE-AT-0058]
MVNRQIPLQDDDQTLLAARVRAQGMNWAPIQQMYFPSKTPSACRKRHERLMERRSAADWDGMKLENLAKNYMGMRREIWSALAAQTGEKWNVVEQKCMSQGLKNLQTAARSSARREHILDPSSANYSHSHSHGSYTSSEAHTDDSGYADEHDHDIGAVGGMAGTGMGGYGMHQGRLPSMDMGIDAIINRPLG